MIFRDIIHFMSIIFLCNIELRYMKYFRTLGLHIHFFGTHIFYQDTGLMRNAKEGQKATWTGRLDFPQSWPLSQHEECPVSVSTWGTHMRG